MKKIFTVVLLLGFGVFPAAAQYKRKSGSMASKPNQQSKFLEMQWWLGFKAGTNLTQAVPIKRYAIMTPTNYAAAFTDKSYESFNKAGSQASIEITFYSRLFIQHTTHL